MTTRDTTDDTPQVPAEPGELCDCGRPAVVAFVTEHFGRVPWCGTNNLPPVDSREAMDQRIAERRARHEASAAPTRSSPS